MPLPCASITMSPPAPCRFATLRPARSTRDPERRPFDSIRGIASETLSLTTSRNFVGVTPVP
jgi:hypothetical protein